MKPATTRNLFIVMFLALAGLYAMGIDMMLTLRGYWR